MPEAADRYRSARLYRGKALSTILRIRELLMLFVKLVVKTDISNQYVLIIPGISEVRVFLMIKFILFCFFYAEKVNNCIVVFNGSLFYKSVEVMLDTESSTIIVSLVDSKYK